MQLSGILLTIVAVLTLLSGVAILLGSSKKDRVRSVWFFVATVLATVWTVSMVLFIEASPEWAGFINIIVDIVYINSILIDVALLGYVVWKQKYGKLITLSFAAVGLLISGFIFCNPALLYSDVNLSNSMNSLTLNVGPFLFACMIYFGCLMSTIVGILLKRIIKNKTINKDASDLVLLISFAIAAIASLVFDLILTFWTWRFVWIGPFSIGAVIVAVYYAILHHRAVNVSSRWLNLLSYVVIITSIAIVYMLIFYVIFAALFKGSSPSVEVMLLNFVMIMIVIALLPATNELTTFVRSLISNQQVDMVYVIKKLSRVSPSGVKLNELAVFLSEHLHFDYIGIVLDGQVYGSDNRKIPDASIKLVEKLGDPERGVWQEFNEQDENWRKLNFAAVAALRNASGKTFGQIIVSKPSGRIAFSHRDLVQVETVINLAAVIIDSKTHHRKA